MNFVYIATSIDGYIATSDGGIEWLHEQPNPDNCDYGYSEFISNIDALVMGRHTFEKVMTFYEWPYDKKVFVLSTMLSEVSADMIGKVEFITGTPYEVQSSIRAKGFDNLYIDGGQVVQSFLAADLIDELIITRIPILLGNGIPLFGDLAQPLKLVHNHTKVYDNALVKSFYSREK
jgi:dihydrofolate reductase